MATNANPPLTFESNPSTTERTEGNSSGTATLALRPAEPDNSRLIVLAEVASKSPRLLEPSNGLLHLLQAARSLEYGDVSQQERTPKVTARRAGKTKKRSAIIIFSMRSGRIKARRAIPRRSAMVSITSPWPPPAANKTANEKDEEEGEDEEEQDEEM